MGNLVSSVKNAKVIQGRVKNETKLATEEETWNEVALRNEVILREIFANLPTKLLLRSCSLVNKTWNREARKFIRDHRICKVSSNRRESVAVCEFLQELDNLCGQMAVNGRLVPFNHLAVIFDKDCRNHFIKSDEAFYSNLIGLKLKHLVISVMEVSRFECSRSIIPLLRDTSHEVKNLQISDVWPFPVFREDAWSPRFPNLETLVITETFLYDQTKHIRQERNDMFRWLLKDVPKLKSVRMHSYLATSDLTSFEILPEEKMALVKLQGSLEISSWTKRSLNLLLAACTSELTELYIRNPLTHFEEKRAGEIDADLLVKFYTALERILQSAHQSLETIEVDGDYRLGRLTHPPLIKLSKLTVVAPFEGWGLWNAIVSIDFETKMPILKEVELYALNTSDIYIGRIPYRSNTVCKLTIHIETLETKLRPLSVLFPSVSVLHCQWEGRESLIAPVCKYWCHLEEIKLTQTYCFDANLNYDAEFCGIYEEEAELLRQQGVSYLKSVHIVPVRPCMLNIRNLLKLCIEELEPAEDRGRLITNVTHFVALSRMPHLNVLTSVWPMSRIADISDENTFFMP